MAKAPLIKVRLIRVEDKPQRYAAHSIKDNTLLGYCGRDGRITHPVTDLAPGTLTDITAVDDQRRPRKGLVRSMAAVDKMLEKPSQKTPKKDAKWVEVSRKELGLFASGDVSGPGWSNGGFFHIVYEVTETLKTGKSTEMRIRTVTGRPCRMQREGYEAFVSLYRTYAGHARQHEENMHVERHLKCYFKDEIKKQDAEPDDTLDLAAPPIDGVTKTTSKTKGKSAQ